MAAPTFGPKHSVMFSGGARATPPHVLEDARFWWYRPRSDGRVPQLANASTRHAVEALTTCGVARVKSFDTVQRLVELAGRLSALVAQIGVTRLPSGDYQIVHASVVVDVMVQNGWLPRDLACLVMEF